MKLISLEYFAQMARRQQQQKTERISINLLNTYTHCIELGLFVSINSRHVYCV